MLLLICVLIFLVLYLKKKKKTSLPVSTREDSQTNPRWIVDRNLGNYLSEYFAEMGLAFFHGHDFHWRHEDKSPFYQQLPRHIPFNPQIQSDLKKNGYTGPFGELNDASFWVVDTSQKNIFWTTMKPYVFQMYETMFRGVGMTPPTVNTPVIHYRCSDAPFVKNVHYYFQKYRFFSDALTDLGYPDSHHDTVLMIACHDHNTDPDHTQKCEIYRTHLMDYLEDKGWNIIVQCKSPLEDFATMVYAPAVISTSSSFSFMAGFFGKGIFVSEGHYTDNTMQNDTFNSCNKCPWQYHGYSLLHKDVPTYDNVQDVTSMLR